MIDVTQVEMVVVDGVRYRAEDAKRLGLTPDTTEAKAIKPANKSRKPANKAVDPSDVKE